MAECKKIRKLITLAHYDEISPEEKKALAEHLASCPQCTKEFNRLQKTFQIMDKRERKYRGSEFWQTFDQKLNLRLEKESRIKKTSSRGFFPKVALKRLIPQLAAGAAILILGIFLGRYIWIPETPTIPGKKLSSPPLFDTSSSLNISQNFEKIRMVLMSIMNFDPETEDVYALDLIRQQILFEHMAALNEEIQKSALASKDKRIYELASDLEIILRQMANLENPQNSQNIKMIQSALMQKDILFRLRLFNIRHQRMASPGHTNPVI
ncbi:MAG: hypothetical protein GF421_03005 [Candidatus Aminicenantes bacterium]|nr:hypothetical protein [Candidatus Aminicenantes bacterium]